MAHPSKNERVTLRLTAEQYRLIEQRARKCGVRLPVWMRSVLLQAAKREASEGYVRIKEPDGATT